MNNLIHRIGFATGTLLLLTLLAPLSVMAADGGPTACPSTATPVATTCPPATTTPAATTCPVTPAVTACPATPAIIICPTTPAASPAATACPVVPAATTCPPATPVSTPQSTTLVGGRITVEVSCDNFTRSDGTVNMSIQVKPGQFFDVVLCSNRSTGFQWSEMAKNDGPSIVSQGGHTYLAPPAGSMIGAAGKEVWTFGALREGQAVLSFEYSQPWQGGEKAVWTSNLVVVVTTATPAATPAVTGCPVSPAATACPATTTPAATGCPATPATTPAATACPTTPAATPAVTTCPVTPAVTTCPVTPAATPAITTCPATPAATTCPPATTRPATTPAATSCP